MLNSLIEAFFLNFISIIFSFRENGHQRAGMTLALNFCCRNYQLWTVTTSQVKFLSDNSSPGNNFNLGQATCLFFFLVSSWLSSPSSVGHNWFKRTQIFYSYLQLHSSVGSDTHQIPLTSKIYLLTLPSSC